MAAPAPTTDFRGGTPHDDGFSFLSYSPASIAKGAVDIGKKIYGSTQQQQQPGVGGAAKDPSKLVRDPTTGLYYDPTTGTSYTDPMGQSVVTNPNVAQQVATNVQRSGVLLNQFGQAFAGQTGLADSLRGTIAGTTPSVAQTQLQLGLGGIADQQLAQAAGASGENAAMARLAAMNNTARAGIGANQAAALTRAQEVADAQRGLAGVLGAQANEGLTGGENFASLGLTGQENQQGLNHAANAANAGTNASFLRAGGDALTGLHLGGGGAGGGGASPGDGAGNGLLAPTSFSSDIDPQTGLRKRGLAQQLAA
jgi:hypothetical protein